MWQKRIDSSAAICVKHGQSIFDEQSTVLFIMSELQNIYLKHPNSSLFYVIQQVHNKLIKPKYLLNYAMCNGARIFDFNLLLLFLYQHINNIPFFENTKLFFL